MNAPQEAQHFHPLRDRAPVKLMATEVAQQHPAVLLMLGHAQGRGDVLRVPGSQRTGDRRLRDKKRRHGLEIDQA